MNSFAQRPRLRQKVKHILISTMLCCGKRKEPRGGETVETLTEQGVVRRMRQHRPELVLQRDFRKVSGISTEIFRQIEEVENDYDAATAQAVDAVERRGREMIIRLFDPCTLGRVGADAYRQYLSLADAAHAVRFIEIIKRPGQTLGLYIREGDGLDPASQEGVFVSRIALESPVYNSGLLKVGDEILAVNLVDVRRMSLDDVVIVMSIPRRLVLTIRSRMSGGPRRIRELTRKAEEARPAVVIMKKAPTEEVSNEESNSENGALIRARTIGLPPEVPAIAVKLSERDVRRERQRYQRPEECPGLYYNSQPRTAGKTYRPPPPPSQTPAYTAKGVHRWIPPPPIQPQVVTRQPKPTAPSRKTYPQPMEGVDEGVHPYYRTRTQEIPPEESELYRPHHRRTRSVAAPKDTPYGRWGEDRDAPLRKSTGMLRTESDFRMFSDEDYEREEEEEYLPSEELRTYPRVSERLRRRFHVSPTMQHRGRVRRYYDDHSEYARGGILRRSGLDSASDTEAQQVPVQRIRRGYGVMPGRSHSLPRARTLPRPRRPGGPPTVRFTSLPYDSQEESDGAVSAPELPATRSAFRRRPLSRRPPSVFTASEYRAWMSRAPSTSAIYERLRRGKGLHQAQISRIAHSAESLLDTARQEDFRGIYTMPRRLHTPSEESLPGGAITRDYMSRLPPHPSPLRPSDDRLHLLSLDPREFSKYRPRLTTPVRTEAPPKEGYSGLLWIHLLSGRGLRPTAHADHFRDLYCVIECDRVHKARTVIRTGEHSFDWDEVFEIDLVENRETSFLLYSWDPRFRHKLCYKGTLHLAALLRQSSVHSLALKMEPRGTLYLKLRFKDPIQTFQRLPAPTEDGIFGVDLETLLMKEDSGLGVPLIVKRCTEEVERRGMDIVGVYRLCGSAIRKRMLREEFERSALRVDLSVEHVPDINVVTSLLKDYLRELPEPLLTRSLYDMLVDGLSVCLPEDPDGNAKLMFSILECLPRANLCTVLLLLDHLRLVASHSDRNKMTADGLAMAFGPVLMCHAETTTTAIDVRRPISVMTFLVKMWPAKRSPRLWYDAASGEVFRM